MQKCKECHQPVESDGYGELVHVATAKYGCNPKAKRDESYPVAS